MHYCMIKVEPLSSMFHELDPLGKMQIDPTDLLPNLHGALKSLPCSRLLFTAIRLMPQT